MTVQQMKDYFQSREPGVQGAAGEFAILVPLVEREDGLSLLFETRALTLKGHQPGEDCFPGGRREPAETPAETVLRETREELGIPPEEVELLAPLDVIQDISDRVIWPFLGRISPAGLRAIQENRSEVKDTFLVPLDYLLSYPEEVYRYPVGPEVDDSFPFDRIGFPHDYPWRRGWMDVPIYEYQGHYIWGMTGRTVRWLLDRLRAMEG